MKCTINFYQKFAFLLEQYCKIEWKRVLSSTAFIECELFEEADLLLSEK